MQVLSGCGLLYQPTIESCIFSIKNRRRERRGEIPKSRIAAHRGSCGFYGRRQVMVEEERLLFADWKEEWILGSSWKCQKEEEDDGNNCADHVPGVASVCPCHSYAVLQAVLGEVTWEQVSFILVSWELEGIYGREDDPSQASEMAATISCHVWKKQVLSCLHVAGLMLLFPLALRSAGNPLGFSTKKQLLSLLLSPGEDAAFLHFPPLKCHYSPLCSSPKVVYSYLLIAKWPHVTHIHKASRQRHLEPPYLRFVGFFSILLSSDYCWS